ncbi:MAG: thymidylate synthase [Candidatus Thioglobus sp.]|nr:MAG: thymidylate synthase [Candidatus Thioglobus sp.]KAA0454064.1 MAG: thymidylate synthase [Candidatus Thioglobus sp.]
MKAYIDIGRRILDEGVWTTNARTGQKTLAVIGASFEHDLSIGTVPVVTTKKIFWKSAIAEMLGYIRGYRSAAQFRELGCNTWNANANENQAWLDNPNRLGKDDMGMCYGVIGRAFPGIEGDEPFDQYQKIVSDLSQGIDDRREIMSFNHPNLIHRACLPACMHTHHFNLLGDDLYLESYQRSSDYALGQPFNHLQVAFLLLITAQITGKKAKKMRHHLSNVHLYENQVEIFKNQQLNLQPLPLPSLQINPEIKSLKDLETWVTMDDFELQNYQHHQQIKYPFSV